MGKKRVIIIGAAVVVVAAGITAFAVLGQKTSAPLNESNLVAVKACDALTLDEAKTILGDSAVAGEVTSPASTVDLNVDSCLYTNGEVSFSEQKAISIMARSALTADGVASNEEAFQEGGGARRAGAEEVTGYGDVAYWDPEFSQLAVLSGNTWYGIIYARDSGTQGSSLEEAKTVADLIVK